VSRLRRLLFLFLVIVTKHFLKIALEFLEERHYAALFFGCKKRIESVKEMGLSFWYEPKLYEKEYGKSRASVATVNNTLTRLIYYMDQLIVTCHSPPSQRPRII
jgi:hypothetical protein